MNMNHQQKRGKAYIVKKSATLTLVQEAKVKKTQVGADVMGSGAHPSSWPSVPVLKARSQDLVPQ